MAEEKLIDVNKTCNIDNESQNSSKIELDSNKLVKKIKVRDKKITEKLKKILKTFNVTEAELCSKLKRLKNTSKDNKKTTIRNNLSRLRAKRIERYKNIQKLKEKRENNPKDENLVTSTTQNTDISNENSLDLINLDSESSNSNSQQKIDFVDQIENDSSDFSLQIEDFESSHSSLIINNLEDNQFETNQFEISNKSSLELKSVNSDSEKCKNLSDDDSLTRLGNQNIDTPKVNEKDETNNEKSVHTFKMGLNTKSDERNELKVKKEIVELRRMPDVVQQKLCKFFKDITEKYKIYNIKNTNLTEEYKISENLNSNSQTCPEISDTSEKVKITKMSDVIHKKLLNSETDVIKDETSENLNSNSRKSPEILEISEKVGFTKMSDIIQQNLLNSITGLTKENEKSENYNSCESSEKSENVKMSDVLQNKIFNSETYIANEDETPENLISNSRNNPEKIENCENLKTIVLNEVIQVQESTIDKFNDESTLDVLNSQTKKVSTVESISLFDEKIYLNSEKSQNNLSDVKPMLLKENSTEKDNFSSKKTDLKSNLDSKSLEGTSALDIQTSKKFSISSFLLKKCKSQSETNHEKIENNSEEQNPIAKFLIDKNELNIQKADNINDIKLSEKVSNSEDLKEKIENKSLSSQKNQFAIKNLEENSNAVPENDVELKKDLNFALNIAGPSKIPTKTTIIQNAEFEIDKISPNLSQNTSPAQSQTSLDSPQQIVPLFQNINTDEDIRNKIKLQLELLRGNRKVFYKDVTKQEHSISKIAQNIFEPAQSTSKMSQNDSLNDSKVIENGVEVEPKNIKDVLLSNESEHLIVSVIGGYVSDDDTNRNEKNSKISLNNTNLSISDILLQKNLEKSCKLKNKNAITPTKTRDITKIKGWRKKCFSISETEENDLNENELIIEENTPNISDNPKEVIQNFLAYDEPSTSKGIIKTPEKIETNKISDELSESILKQGEKLSTDSKSAFVSDVLDSFLTNDADLKISYEIPKLKAEEGITKPLSDIPIVPIVGHEPDRVKPKKEVTGFKPKTLAEKRKMLEQEKKTKMAKIALNENYIKNLEKENGNKNIKEHFIKGTIPFSKNCWALATKDDRSRNVVVNGQKIKIVGSFSEDMSDIKVKEIKTVLNPPKVKKILNPNQRKYKPGPLSKKCQYLKNKDKTCEYKVLKMPKIKLVIYPEQGKKLPLIAEQYLSLCKSDKGFISEEYAKFAVSALKNSTPEKVEFDIPYNHNQNKILLRKVTKKEEKVILDKYPDIIVDNDIKNIMSDLLDSILNQELDKVIIKEDPHSTIRQTDMIINDLPIENYDNALIIKQRNHKKSKTTLELRRLNVQVIEVDVEDTPKIDKTCTEDFCRMGCICNSLLGLGNSIPDHCGREACMFECSCAKTQHKSVKLPAGTDLLSASTMVRLKDEAVKHLAKEEKEFTQTVIKANNQTIVVGGGARERQRRIPKPPKKFNDYINTSDEIINIKPLNEEPPEKKEVSESVFTRKTVPIWKNAKAIEERTAKDNICYVSVERLNLNDILPYCMVHNLYKCYCGGQPSKPTLIIKKTTEKIDENEFITYKSRNNDLDCARTQKLQNNYYQKRNKSKSYLNNYEQIRKEEKMNERKETRGRKRKSLDESNTRLTRKRERISYAQDSSDEDKPLKIRITPEMSEENKIVPLSSLIEPKIESKPPETDTNLTKNDVKSPEEPQRKYISVKNDSKLLAKHVKTNEPESQTNNVPKETFLRSGMLEKGQVASLIDYKKSYDGLIIPTQEWLNTFKDMLSVPYARVKSVRLLQWPILVRRYQANTIQVWVNSKNNYSNVIITENKRRPSRFHMNIKMFGKASIDAFKVPSLVESLMSDGKPPKGKNPDETYVILVNYGMDWEARGIIVLNNIQYTIKRELKNRPLPYNILFESVSPVTNKKPEKDELPVVLNEHTANQIEITKIPMLSPKKSPLKKILPRNTTLVNISDIQKKEVKQSELNGIVFPSKSMIVEKIDNPEKTCTQFLANLPTGKETFHWFMLKLDNDFSVLKITSTNFVIKYTHLISAINMAKKNQKTVRIRTPDPSKVHHTTFGIYAVPDYTDKIFFGPYLSEKEHYIETLRYANGKLVSTNAYNLLQGLKPDIKSIGMWFKQKSDINNTQTKSEIKLQVSRTENQPKSKVEFVDLTENDSDEESKKTDPLFNVLSADFTKHLAGDVTIEKIPKNKKKDTNNTEITKKRKIIVDLDPQSPKKQVAIEITEPKRIEKEISPKSNEKKMPYLYPLNPGDFEAKKKIQVSPKMTSILKPISLINLVSNVNALGYFDVMHSEDYYHIPGLPIEENTPKKFNDIGSTISWLESYLKEKIVHVPSTFNLGLTVWKNKEHPPISKFNDDCLNGLYIICSKGLFNVYTIKTATMESMGMPNEEIHDILYSKFQLLIKKNIRRLANILFDDAAEKIDDAEVLALAPKKIQQLTNKETTLIETRKKLVEQQKAMITKIKGLLNNTSDNVQDLITNNLGNILAKNFSKVKDVNLKKTINKSIPLPEKSTVNINNSDEPNVKFKLMNGYFIPIKGVNTNVNVNTSDSVKIKTNTNTTIEADIEIVDLTDS